MSRSGADDAFPVGGRVIESRWKRWFLLDGNRFHLAALGVVAAFLALIAMAAAAPTPLRALMEAGSPTEALFQALVISVVTGVTLVVTIAQMVLSQELGSVGDQHDRMEGSLAFQHEIEDMIDVNATPVATADFLRVIVEACGERADELAEAASDVTDDRLRDRVQRYAATVADDASSVTDALEGAPPRTFDVVFAVLQFDYTGMLHEGRRLQGGHDAALPDATGERVGDLVELLAYFGSAREHVKTLYFEAELISLARDVIYSAVPALVVSIGMVLYGESLTEVVGTVLGVDVIVWLVLLAVTVAVLPFLVLLAYILRVVTITQLTLAAGPLELQETLPPEQRSAGSREDPAEESP